MTTNALLVSPLPFTVLASASWSNTQNLLNDRLGRASTMSAGSGDNGHVDIDLGAAISVDTIAFLATSAGAGATWRIQAYSDLSFASGALVYDSGFGRTLWASADAARRVHRQSFLNFDPVTARYWRFLAYSGPYDVGRLVIGKALIAADSIDVGWSFKVIDTGDDRVSQTQLDDPTIRGKVLEYNWAWSWMTQAEARGALLDLLAFAGITRPMLLCLNPEASDVHNLIGFGMLQDLVESTSLVAGAPEELNAYSAQFRLRSRLVLSL